MRSGLSGKQKNIYYFFYVPLVFTFPQAGQVVEFVSVFPPVWRCVEDTGNCPGRFEYACPEEPLQLVDEECDCPSQYLVSILKFS